MYDELVNSLRICGKIRSADDYCVAFHDGCCEAEPVCMYELMMKAADAIEELRDALLLMVLQYCATDDGLLYHSFMSAGENAFAVLGLENGQQADLLWDRVLVQKPPKEET